jgi:hypothetical protein
MLVNVECPFCGKVSRVDPARVGEFIDCPECRARLSVPNPVTDRDADEKITFEDAPRRDQNRRPPSRRMWAATLRLMICAAIVLLLIGFVVVQRIQKMQRPIVRRARPAPGWPQQQGLKHRRRVPAGAENLPNLRDKLPGDNEEDAAPAAHVIWRVIPDPPAETVALPPNRVVRIPIPAGPNPEVLFPATPSTMVSVGNVGHGREHREIWDYRANRRLGTTRGLRTHSENLGGFYRPISALSSDGHLFVTQSQDPLALAVWDVSREKQLGLVKPEHAPTAGLTFAAFAQPDELLVCRFGAPFQVLDVAGTSHRVISSFPPDKEFDERSLVLSPGGRYVVAFDKRRSSLRFFDVAQGAEAGELSWPLEHGGSKTCDGVSFSPDGRELAALLSRNGDTFLICWTLGSGLPTDRIDFQGNLRTILASPLPYLFTPLEWFPDGKRWLVEGQGIVDRRTRKLVATLPDEPNRWRFGLRHVGGDDCVLSIVEEKDRFVLASLRVGTQNVERAPAHASSGGRLDQALTRRATGE